jgi:nodulation protein E
MPENIVVSGMGCITACGLGVDALWDSVIHNRSGIKIFEHEYNFKNKVNIAGKITNFNHNEHFSRQTRIDLFSAYAALAAREAITDSKLSQEELSDSRTGIVLGNGFPGAETIFNYVTKLNSGSYVNDIFTVPRAMTNAAISYVCIENKIYGASYPLGAGCAAGNQAIGLGLHLIRSGALDRVIVGGTEATIQPYVMRAWEYMNALSDTGIRPFSADRNGVVLGEGSGVLVLERESFAVARGIKPHAYILGYSTTNDAFHLVQPDSEGLVKCIVNAITDSGLSLQDIDYVSAHGTGTKLNDKNEVGGLRRIFGSHADNLPISSTKPIHGHMIAAVGAVEAIITIKAMQNNYAPPTLNYTTHDPECDMDVIPNVGRNMTINYAMSNNFAFGGINATVVFGKY